MAGGLQALGDFWQRQHQTGGKWRHPDDETVLNGRRHKFMLDYPVVPFIGDILHAPVILLGANAGYGAETPLLFNGEHAIPNCLADIARGDTSHWSATVPYYQTANYGWRLRSRRYAVVNACAYRSLEAPAPAIVEDLPSARMTRTWLLNALIPLVRDRQRLIVAWRPRLWGVDCKHALATLADASVVYANPRSKHLPLDVLARADRFSDA